MGFVRANGPETVPTGVSRPERTMARPGFRGLFPREEPRGFSNKLAPIEFRALFFSNFSRSFMRASG
jgi:hypothetical protein